MKPVVLSLQGCMATGKTTAVQYLQIQEPRISVSFESNRHVIEDAVVLHLIYCHLDSDVYLRLHPRPH